MNDSPKLRVRTILLCGATLLITASAGAAERKMKIRERYLNLPVSHAVERARMTLKAEGAESRQFVIRLADGEPDYWVFCDMTPYLGRTLTVSYDGDGDGLAKIYQSDEIAGADSLYRERTRPRLHYTQRRGWNNDPNGLLWYDGEYHLFYQHNPYEREWENMHWGHAVSRDLVHWQELPEALRPDSNGTVFSGSAVVDYDNTSGFGSRDNPPMVALYTGARPDRQVQCVAYSLDRGRTWRKYDGNPVIDSKERWGSVDTRDPKVFRYEPNDEWVMVLNERDGHSIYTSENLKEWTYRSHTTGFWECPELFELPVDGDPYNTRWVMYGASGNYMIGSFDGRTFTPEAGKFRYSGGAVYAAQTFNGIPARDGRRIQIGWEQVSHPGLPVKGCMTLPTCLTLRTTPLGIRMFCRPVRELETLELPGTEGTGLSAAEADALLRPYAGFENGLRLRFTLRLSHATGAGLSLDGQNLLDYDLNFNRVNGCFYSPADPTSMTVAVDMILDRTSVELFVDDGAFVHYQERRPANGEGFRFRGNGIEVTDLKISPMKSIWE